MDLDCRLPSGLTGELLSAGVTAINPTPSSREGPTTTLSQLITGKRLRMKKFKFGRVGMCECRREDSPDLRAEWGIYMGTLSSVDGRIRVFIPERGLLYSRCTFRLAPRSPSITERTSAPAEWNYTPRRRPKRRWEPTAVMPKPKMGDGDTAQEGVERWWQPNAPVQRTEAAAREEDRNFDRPGRGGNRGGGCKYRVDKEEGRGRGDSNRGAGEWRERGGCRAERWGR